MDEKVLVSVIIPCYNVEAYIEECLDSVFNQTYAHLEVIVVDNNSMDRTVELVDAYKLRHGLNFTLIREENQGLSFARNAGLKIATGEWIQFLDADDLLMPEKIAHQIALIYDGLDLIMAATIERRVDGSEFIMEPHENVVFGLMAGYRHVGSSCSNLWKKQTLLNLNGFDSEQKSSVEIDMMFRMYAAGAVFLRDMRPLTIIRRRSEGQMSQDRKDVLAFYWLRLRVKQLDWFFVQHEYILNKELMMYLFNRFLVRTHYQSESNLLLSHHQYHQSIMPVFRSLIKELIWREKIKNYLYLSFGFKRVRILVDLFK